MAKYSWDTTWRIRAPIQDVWEAIYDTAEWPKWWRFVEKAEEVAPGDASGIGSVWRYVWKTRLWYKIRFDMRTTRVEPRAALEGRASGKVAGSGLWTFFQQGDVCVVRYQWNIETNVWWMNLFAPLLRPFFNWNHDAVMKEGGEGLAKRLNTELVAAGNT